MPATDPRDALAAAAAAAGVSLAALSRLIGRNAAYLQQYVMRGSPRRLAEADRANLAAYLGVSESVLGGGAKPVRTIPRLDVTASAGPGAFAEDAAPFGHIPADPAFLRLIGARPGMTVEMLRARGTSMLPTIADGDELAVDIGCREVKREGLYVLRHDGTLLVKRVRPDRGALLILSDNADVPSLGRTPAKTVDVIGRVLWLGRRLPG